MIRGQPIFINVHHAHLLENHYTVQQTTYGGYADNIIQMVQILHDLRKAIEAAVGDSNGHHVNITVVDDSRTHMITNADVVWLNRAAEESVTIPTYNILTDDNQSEAQA